MHAKLLTDVARRSLRYLDGIRTRLVIAKIQVDMQIVLRAYNAATDLWSIWWLDGRHPDRVDTPMVGRFEGGAGRTRESNWIMDFTRE